MSLTFKAIGLSIQENLCLSCGHTWKTSQAIAQSSSGYNYVANHPELTRSLYLNPGQVSCIVEATHISQHGICYHCIDQSLPKGWIHQTTPLATLGRPKAPVIPGTDLDHLLD